MGVRGDRHGRHVLDRRRFAHDDIVGHASVLFARGRVFGGVLDVKTRIDSIGVELGPPRQRSLCGAPVLRVVQRRHQHRDRGEPLHVDGDAVKERAGVRPLDPREPRRLCDGLQHDGQDRGADRDRRAGRELGFANRRLIANERRALRQRTHAEPSDDELHVEVTSRDGEIAEHQVRIARAPDDPELFVDVETSPFVGASRDDERESRLHG